MVQRKVNTTIPGMGAPRPTSGTYPRSCDEADASDDGQEADEITTPGDMTWVPCTHAQTTKDRFGTCEACRGTGRVLMLVNRLPGRYCIVSD